jgi:hypothetical protein
MAIRFKFNLDILRTDLAAGGFIVRAVHEVAEGCGRTLDVALSNGTVVCWDAESNFVWAEGPCNEVHAVERFLRRLYEKPRFLRQTIAWQNRWALQHRKASSAVASWLMRSETAPARLLRYTIRGLPAIRRRANVS